MVAIIALLKFGLEFYLIYVADILQFCLIGIGSP